MWATISAWKAVGPTAASCGNTIEFSKSSSLEDRRVWATFKNAERVAVRLFASFEPKVDSRTKQIFLGNKPVARVIIQAEVRWDHDMLQKSL